MKKFFLLSLVFLISGCAATHQVKFDYWRGMPPEVAAQLKQGDLPFAKDKVFQAVTDVMDKGPFFQWHYQQIDPDACLVDATTGSDMELKIKVTELAGDGASGGVKLAVELPKKLLASQKDIWINNTDGLEVTAYEVGIKEHHQWHSVSAMFLLDSNYWVSAVYRNLTDKSAVPFDLMDLAAGASQATIPTPGITVEAAP